MYGNNSSSLADKDWIRIHSLIFFRKSLKHLIWVDFLCWDEKLYIHNKLITLILYIWKLKRLLNDQEAASGTN